MSQLDLDTVQEGEYVVEGLFDDVWSGVKSVVKSPVTKAVAGGVALAFPAVGVPAVAALTISGKVISDAERGDAKARATVKNTATLAEQGHPDAQRAMKVLSVAKANGKLGLWSFGKPAPKVAPGPASLRVGPTGAKTAAGWMRSENGQYRKTG